MKLFIATLLVFTVGVGVGVAGKSFQYTQQTLDGAQIDYTEIAKTNYWDVLIPEGGSGRTLALGQNGTVRVTVVDDGPTLYVLTYKDGKRLWEGRLMDIGNDGSIEIANISGKQCEVE